MYLVANKLLQTPLHYVYYFIWGQFVDSNEYLLRLANIPFFLAGQFCLYIAASGYNRSFKNILLLLSAMHPMVWQYANEARPYIMMLGGTQMLLAYFLHLYRLPVGTTHVGAEYTAMFVLGGIILFGASLVGGFWLLSAIIVAFRFHRNNIGFEYLKAPAQLVWTGFFFIGLIFLSLYYIFSVIAGSGVSRISTTNLSNVVFDMYELIGLAGIGPGRLDMRESGFRSVYAYLFPLLLTASLFIYCIYMGICAALDDVGKKVFIFFSLAFLVPGFIVITLGVFMHMRVLGRHLIAIVPAICLLYTIGVMRLLDHRRHVVFGYGSSFVAAIVFCLAYSSLSLRSSERHKKDDYRSAAAIAIADSSQGKRVWWAADDLGAKYYSVPIAGSVSASFGGPGCDSAVGVNLVLNPTSTCLASLVRPDTVILSKVETFDSGNSVTKYLKENGFAQIKSLPAFTIWR